MEKTRGRAIFVSAASTFGAAALQLSGYTSPLWARLFGAIAVGAFVFAVKPQWASIHIWGKEHGAVSGATGDERGALPMFDLEGTHFTAIDTKTTGDRPVLRAKDSKVKLKRWWHAE